MLKAVLATCASVLMLAAVPVSAQSVRDFTRSKSPNTAASQLSETQATEVTLTLTEAQFRPIQTWVRAAGRLDPSARLATVSIKGAQAFLVEPGQRLRAFSVNSRAQMQQGRVTRVRRSGSETIVEAELTSPLFGNPARCIIEIVTEAGPYLSIPNVSIIEEDGVQLVYLQEAGGRYVQKPIKTGIQGELYTQVVEGLNENDEVVSVGSFFVDADSKLKATGGMGAMAGMDHGSMPGMDHSTMNHGAPPVPGPLALTMSDPANDASVAAPMMIHVMFSKPVDVAKSKIEITGPTGARVPTDVPSVMGKDGTMLMVMPDKPLPSGKYLVKWSTVAGQSETASGEFGFSVR